MFLFKSCTIVLSVFLTECFSQTHHGPSRQPIAVTPPKLPGGFKTCPGQAIENCVTPTPGPFLRDFTPPYPTNSWWAGLTVEKDENGREAQDRFLAGPFPFQSRTVNDGFQFGIATFRKFNGVTLSVYEQMDLSVSIGKIDLRFGNRKATAWDTQTVSIQYDGTDGSTMSTTLVPGSPYMTFKFSNAQPILRSISGSINFKWDVTGKKGRVTAGSTTYLLYVVNGSLNQFTLTNTLNFAAGFNGTIRLANLLNATQESILDAHQGTYATALTMAYSVQGNVSSQTWTWDVVGDPTKLLIMSWPHHRNVLVSPKYVTIEYLNMKGIMKGVVGNKWTLKHTLPEVKWSATLPPDPSCLVELMKTLEYEVNRLSVSEPRDFYFWGGQIAARGRLALIADALGRTDLVQKVVDILKQSYNFWFIPGRSQGAAYETKWGGVVSLIGNNSQNYNDHHFLYSYFLYGAALIGKYDPAWLTQNIDFVTHIARDYGNPSPDDPHYPVSRNFDFFTGHSWASGVGGGAGPRNQESSSEAINAYYALALFGDSTKNVELVKWARLLLAMEIQATQLYWHLYPDKTNTPYPEKPFRDHITVGNLYASSVDFKLHWSYPAEKIQVAAIQILPVTVMGETFYDKEWIKNVVPYCQNELQDAFYAEDWKSVIYAAFAKVDPQEAYKYSTQLTYWGTGNTASNQLYFVSTQPSSRGAICTPRTPEGLFNIQDIQTGNYVGVRGNYFGVNDGGILKAIYPSILLATKFRLEFMPGGGSIQSVSTGLYVGANPEVTAPLAAKTKAANAWERFRWIPVGNDYQLTSIIEDLEIKKKLKLDRIPVSTGPDGALINKAGVTPGQYRLIPATAELPLVPAEGKLQSIFTSRFVVATAQNPKLLATEMFQDRATKFRFEKVPNTELFAIRSADNGKAVTANVNGMVPLAATATTAQSWEQFRILKQNDQWVLVHEVGGKAVAVQPDATLLNNDIIVGPQAWFRIL